jgi:hypothetical protein
MHNVNLCIYLSCFKIGAYSLKPIRLFLEIFSSLEAIIAFCFTFLRLTKFKMSDGKMPEKDLFYLTPSYQLTH